MTYGTLCHAIGHSHSFSHPTFFTVSATDLRELFLLSGVFYLKLLIPRKAEGFSRGDRYFKHVPPPTYLICLSPKELYTAGSIKALWLLEFVKNLLLTGFEFFPR